MDFGLFCFYYLIVVGSNCARKFGATVSIVDEDTEEEKTLQIVGEFEGDISKGLISLTSPMAKGMIGKTVGESFEIATPAGKKFYEIEDIKYV